MPKAVLVMDMPGNCENCACKYPSYKDDALYDCAITGKSIPINGGRYGKKPDWCPLHALPEKKEELPNENYEFGSLGKAFTAGFNACLHEILGDFS